MSDGRDDPIHDFDESPRPAKRQRTSNAAAKAKPAQSAPKKPRGRPKKNPQPPARFDEADSDVPIRSKTKRQSKTRSASVSSTNTKPAGSVAKKATKSKKRKSVIEQSDVSDDAFEAPDRVKSVPRSIRAVSSSDESKSAKAKKPKHRVLEPQRNILADIFVSQMPPQGSDPSILRGPIWIKQPPAPPLPQRVAQPKLQPTMRPALPQYTMAVRNPQRIDSALSQPRTEQTIAQKAAPVVQPRLSAPTKAPAARSASSSPSKDSASSLARAGSHTTKTPETDHSDRRRSETAEISRPSSPVSKKRSADTTNRGLAKPVVRSTSHHGAMTASRTNSAPSTDTVQKQDSARPIMVSENQRDDDDYGLSDLDDNDNPLQKDQGRLQVSEGIDSRDSVDKGCVSAADPLSAESTSNQGVAGANPDKEDFGKQSTYARPAASFVNLCSSRSNAARSTAAQILTAGDRSEDAQKDTVQQHAKSRSNSPPAVSDVIDIAQELDDLPSDAFASSPVPEAIVVSKSTKSAPLRALNLSTLNGGKRQMTLHGSFSEPQDAAQTKAKKTTWPLANRKEKPTHHVLDSKATETWVYPINLGTIREYQYGIVHTGLFHNLLVALPTGLGKTFIAATVMLNWYRWTKEAQIVFVAPTKPLVAQQIDACFHTVGIPRSDTAMLTGEVSPALREEAWRTKRVFFMTPQTMGNDLRKGICDPKKLVLLVVDEAHRATGNYSYIDIVRFIRRFNTSFRILALTATPGSKVETVQQVIDGLDISRVEIRTESSLDIRSYVHSKDIETFLFDYSPDQERVMELFGKAIKPVLDRLNQANASWMKDPMKLSAFGLTQQQKTWAKSEAGRNANFAFKGMINNAFQVLAGLAHAITLLRFHGIGPFFRKIKAFKNSVESGENGKKSALQIKENENFVKMYNQVQKWQAHPDFIGHPKMEHLRQVVLNHFMDAGETGRKDDKVAATRVMVFAHYRDSAEEIVQVLKRNDPMVRPHVFVGQASAEGSDGMDQKAQLAVIEKFRSGTYNTLVATSIGEEGLDIGEVDLIICYDASASPIRMLQRMGRTGRKRQGKIALLLMRDKEERDFAAAKDNYEKMQSMITDGKHFEFHEDRSSRILPRDVRPTVDKRVVEIPVENSQPDLPVPTKAPKGKKKAAPKKFHMPDGVITGFVTASKVNDDGVPEDDSDTEAVASKPARRKSLPKAKTTPPQPPKDPEPVPLPFLEDVLLNKMQERDLVRKYQYVNGDEGTAVMYVSEPAKNTEGFREPSATVFVGHSRSTERFAATMRRMHEVDGVTLARFEDRLHHSDLEEDDSDIFKPADLEIPAAGPPAAADEVSDPATPRPKAKSKPKPRRKSKAKEADVIEEDARPQKAPAPKRKRGRKATRVSSAMEGASSSAPPTPADMRLPSQGIALGSGDTSGEDEVEGNYEDDSDLADFIAKSDDPIEYASSSMPVPSNRPQAPAAIFSSDVEDGSSGDDAQEIGGYDPGADEDMSMRQEAAATERARKRKRVVESDSDE